MAQHDGYRLVHIQGNQVVHILGYSLVHIDGNSTLCLLSSAQALAELMSPSELARRGSCTKEQCFKNDGGKSFLHSCEFQMMNYPPNITVIGPLWVNSKACYCPCTLEYMAGAVRD